MMFLITYWKYLVVAALAFAVAGLLHSLDINRIEARDKSQLDAAVQKQANLCDASKQPKEVTDNVSETNLAHQLDICLGKLQRPAKCIPLHIPRPSGGASAACGQASSGISSAAIDVNNIECQRDRDGLNAAKIWGQEYQKFIKSN